MERDAERSSVLHQPNVMKRTRLALLHGMESSPARKPCVYNKTNSMSSSGSILEFLIQQIGIFFLTDIDFYARIAI